MGKVKLKRLRPNYIERPEVDPKKEMERARQQVIDERNRRACYLIAAAGRA